MSSRSMIQIIGGRRPPKEATKTVLELAKNPVGWEEEAGQRIYAPRAAYKLVVYTLEVLGVLKPVADHRPGSHSMIYSVKMP